MKKIIAVVALDPIASEFYTKQIQELFGDLVEANSYSVAAGTIMNMKRSDLYLMSTDAFENREDVPQYVPIDAQTSELLVTYTWDTIKKLKEIPPGTTALFVNMTEKMVREATTTLNQLGVNHINFIPFYPEAEPVYGVDLAITPDEERYVPKNIKKIMNIGHRSCTSGTMIEVALKLGFDDILEKDSFKEYLSKIATSTYSFDMMFTRSRKLERQFDILMEILDEGIIGINEKCEIFALNKKAEEITKVKKQVVLYHRATTSLPQIPFIQCLQTKKKTSPKVIRINGINISVVVTPVLRQGECIGAFATLQRFSDVENQQNELRSQLMHKGYRAKYTFFDVVGESDEIEKTKRILKRMAKTDSPILLIGETGTGKELFAHAVHNASKRNSEPFVAINCAAMPENLLESELFGYEEGAFTGAKKGGRPGLFEFAHKGTLFLDEVEGMSAALQVKLLRVLQEHEIMRVGGNQIINVDVRIVSATNEHLEDKVENGSFRRDLYYRLNTLPALIPPLRDRGEDVFLLMDKFRTETDGNFTLSYEVLTMFKKYSWPGNIRELNNVVEYLSYTGSSEITSEDLPPTFHYKKKPIFANLDKNKNTNAFDWEVEFTKLGFKDFEYMFILEVLYNASLKKINIGREFLLQEAKNNSVPLSQREVRNILKIFDDLGMVKVSKGRGGSKITPKGFNICKMVKV